MSPKSLLLAALLALSCAAAGCSGLTGLPEGAAGTGDVVTLEYTVEAPNGTALREPASAQFAVGSGASLLGLAFERGVRGHKAGENFTVKVSSDPSLDFDDVVEVDRALPSLTRDRSVNRAGFEANLGVARVGQDYPVFGVYIGTVTAITQSTVNFTVSSQEGQRDPFPTLGAYLVSNPRGTVIERSLDPMVGTAFAIPPSEDPPFGLKPGSYRTEGATATKIQYAYSSGSGDPLLIGRDLVFRVHVLDVKPGTVATGPVDGNYAHRVSPYVNGDPESILGNGTGAAPAGHTH